MYMNAKFRLQSVVQDFQTLGSAVSAMGAADPDADPDGFDALEVAAVGRLDALNGDYQAYTDPATGARTPADPDLRDVQTRSRADLRLRGMGDLFGAQQSGEKTFRYADPLRDEALNLLAMESAEELLRGDPALEKREHQAVRTALSERYQGAGGWLGGGEGRLAAGSHPSGPSGGGRAPRAARMGRPAEGRPTPAPANCAGCSRV